MTTINDDKSTSINNPTNNDEQQQQQQQQQQQPISLLWKNLRYEIDEWNYNLNLNKMKKRKVILKRLNGFVRHHSINALLGPSGAGKTSLIKCLTGNVKEKNISSDSGIYLNRMIVSQYTSNKRIPLVSFVPQSVHEIIFGRFTVEEILYYSFCFKNLYENRHKARSHIESTIEELMLETKVLKTPFDQCSGGQQRRVAIAQELMAFESKPAFLFVDEPTTGLDSEAALIVMECLRKLATNNPITIIVSIHAPSSEILSLFDNLYILAKGGVCIYSGPPIELSSRLESVQQHPIAEDRSPIEEYLRIANNGINDQLVRDLADNALQHEATRFKLEENLNDKHFKSNPNGIVHHSKSFSINDLIIQIQRLFRLIFIADVKYFLCYLLLHALGVGFICLTSYHDMIKSNGCHVKTMDRFNITCSDKLDETLIDGSFMIYQLAMIIVMTLVSIGLSSILVVELSQVFRNEHKNGWYSLATFFWAFQFIHLIELTFFAINQTLLGYLLSEYYILDNYSINWNRLLHQVLFIWLLTILMQSYAQVWGIIYSSNVQLMATALTILFVIITMLSGLYSSLEIMNRPLLVYIAQIFGYRSIINGLYYTFYGIDRCDDGNDEESLQLKKLFINPELIYWNLIPSIINCIILRIVTYLVLYYKYRLPSNDQQKFSIKKFNKFPTPTPSTTFSSKFIPIDYEQSVSIDMKLNHKEDNDENKNAQNGDKNEKFHQKRYIIGWRDLCLYESTTIHEIREQPKSLYSKLPSERLILRNLNGQIFFGSLNALMGPSGSGKTTLLKVLNGRKKIRIPRSSMFYLSKFQQLRTCFVSQEVSNHLMPGLTTLQSLIYASKLKNYNVKEKIDHEKLAWNLLKELSMIDAADTMVQNCSGGQRKRIALALELTSLCMPNLICIDEPTSGLDSNSAHLVIECLKQFVHRHQDIAIVASIHQPNTDQLMMFDQCYVLACDGVCIFSGPPNHIKSYLEEITDSSIYTRFPIETLIKYSCTGHSNSTVRKLVMKTERQIKQTDNELLLDTVAIPEGVQYNHTRFSLKSVLILCQRYFRYTIRHQWREWLTFILVYIMTGILTVNVFDKSITKPSGCMNIEDDLQSYCTNKSDGKILEEIQIANNINFILIPVAVIGFVISMQTMFAFGNELKYFASEHRNGWYSSGSFYTMKFIFETIPLIPIMMMYNYIIDLNDDVNSSNGTYFWKVLVLFLGGIIFHAVSHIVVLLTNGLFIPLMICLFFSIAIFVMTSNFFNPIIRMPFMTRILATFSPIHYLNNANFYLVFGGDRCQPYEIQSILELLMIPNNDETFYWAIIMLIILVIFYHTMALLLLIVKFNPLINRHDRVKRVERYQEKILSK